MYTDAELLAELQEGFDYVLCGKIVNEPDSGEVFCTLEQGHKDDCGGSE